MVSSSGMASPLPFGPRWSSSISTQTTTLTRCCVSLAVWLACFSSLVAAQTLPYVPTTILLPEANTVPLQQNISRDVAYIFSPKKDGSVDLLALNISSTLSATSFSPQTISSGLSFLKGTRTAFAPTIADNGSLVVYAGDCASSANSGIWSLDPRVDASAGWTKEPVAASSSAFKNGPGFLGGTLSFSTTLAPVMSPANVYVYGGMCPGNYSSNYTTSTSDQSGAVYYNQMVKLSQTENASSSYSVQTVNSRGPPVPEAGFSWTGLVPSISNRSGIVTQQLNHVLLGGHTQTAFVNMSTAAIWSLPEESWAFVDLNPSSAGTSTDLKIKSVAGGVQPRSGHTALLNDAGNALIVLGGWVGNTHTAAQPPLAVLQIGTGYGGNGKWQWTIPETQPSGPALYGHGAALLPGNVMMIYGGYTMSSSGAKIRRQAGSGGSANSGATFLNLTSMTWSDVYSNPAYLAAGGAPAISASSSDDARRKLGLGLGLGLGIVALLAAAAVYFWYRRRLRRRHAVREKAIQDIAQDTSHFIHDEDEMLEREGGPGFGWYTGGHDPYLGTSRSLGYESLQHGRGSMDHTRTDPFGPVPVPGPVQAMQIPRKPLAPRAARGAYQPTPSGEYESQTSNLARRSGVGVIHPIAEADEDGDGHVEAVEVPSPLKTSANRDSGNYSDPFVTPTHEKSPPFPALTRGVYMPPEPQTSGTDPEVQHWMTDVDAADALLTSRMATHSAGGAGRMSPTRRGTVKSNRSGYAADDDSRTGSNLSESNHSAFSQAASSIRAGFGLAASAVAAAAVAEGRAGTSGSSSSSSAPSYNTAKSSFPAMQTEGPALLLGRPPATATISPTHRRFSFNNGGNDNEEEEFERTPGSPSKSKPRRGWLGSLKRVFSGPTPSPSPPGTDSEQQRMRDRDSFAGEASDFDPRLGGLGSIAAGGLLKRKGGREAWRVKDLAGEPSSSYRRRDVMRSGGRADEDEWDIEKEVENRLVQVVFSVPKERLRVVNGEPDLESLEDVVVIDPEKEVAYRRKSGGDQVIIEKGYEVVDVLPRHAAVEDDLDKSGVYQEDYQDELRDEIEKSLEDREPHHNEPRERKGKQKGREFIDSGIGSDFGTTTASERHLSPMPDTFLAVSPLSPGGSNRPLSGVSADSVERNPSFASNFSEGRVLNAEAVKFERPRGKVLAMVDTIESDSRENSPTRPKSKVLAMVEDFETKSRENSPTRP